MLLDSPRKAKHCILVAIAFALMASSFNHLLRPLLYVTFVRPPSEPFFLMEAPGLILGIASTLLFWIGRGPAHRISVRGVLTVLGTILGLYVVIFVVVVPLSVGDTPGSFPPALSWSSRDMVTFLMLAIVALDCWLCLGFLVVVEMMTGRLGVGEA
jgi:hypothetical protein